MKGKTPYLQYNQFLAWYARYHLHLSEKANANSVQDDPLCIDAVVRFSLLRGKTLHCEMLSGLLKGCEKFHAILV